MPQKLILISLLLAACGGHPGADDMRAPADDLGAPAIDAATPATKFLGQWVGASGTATLNCPGSQPSTIDFTGQHETITQGDSVDSISVDNGCVFTFTVGGDTASAPAGQTCTEMAAELSCGDAGLLAQVSTLATDVLTTSDGLTMTEAYTETVTPTDCNLTTCTYTATSIVWKRP